MPISPPDVSHKINSLIFIDMLPSLRESRLRGETQCRHQSCPEDTQTTETPPKKGKNQYFSFGWIEG